MAWIRENAAALLVLASVLGGVYAISVRLARMEANTAVLGQQMAVANDRLQTVDTLRETAGTMQVVVAQLLAATADLGETVEELDELIGVAALCIIDTNQRQRSLAQSLDFEPSSCARLRELAGIPLGR